MKIAIIDPARAYAPDAPWTGPLGGTQSAACYLARALAAQDCTADLYNHIAAPATAHGVTARNWTALHEPNAMDGYDALILNGRWTQDMVESLAESGRPVYGWMHEAAFNAEIIVPSAALSGICFVSHWQQRANSAHLPAGVKTAVIENAISPFVEAQLAQGFAKDPNLVIYCGDIERGLRYLPSVWPALHAAHPALKLEVYGPRPDNALGEAIAALPGLQHYGLTGQEQLAARMAAASWHLSPNPYPETSCISLIEALALGCRSITTARAALPETANGFAALCPVADADRNDALTPIDPARFAETALAALGNPIDTTAQQAAFANGRWAERAQRWQAWLS